MDEQFDELDLEKNKPKLEKKTNEPILKFATRTKISYLGPEGSRDKYEENVSDVAKMVLGGGVIGVKSSKLNVCNASSISFFLNEDLNIDFCVSNGAAKYYPFAPTLLKGARFLIIDEYCSKDLKENYKKFIVDKVVDASTYIFVKRSESVTGFENLIPKENIINASNPIDVVKRIRDIADGGKGLPAKDEKMLVENEKMNMGTNINKKLEEVGGLEGEKLEGKKLKGKKLKGKKLKGLGKLFGKVKEHKGKTVTGLLSLLTLEELWRNGVFSGKTDKKQRLQKDKTVEPKNAQISEKKSNSAAT